MLPHLSDDILGAVSEGKKSNIFTVLWHEPCHYIVQSCWAKQSLRLNSAHAGIIFKKVVCCEILEPKIWENTGASRSKTPEFLTHYCLECILFLLAGSHYHQLDWWVWCEFEYQTVVYHSTQCGAGEELLCFSPLCHFLWGFNGGSLLHCKLEWCSFCSLIHLVALLTFHSMILLLCIIVQLWI